MKTKDVTNKYLQMLESFTSDFDLPYIHDDFEFFDELKKLIKEKDEQMIKDIELLEELSFDLRRKKLKIVKMLESEE